jgi:pyrimidine operon attenuation protein/uracil phosphoribosyltransferase
LYDLTVTDGELQTTSRSTSVPFSPEEYSRFKYGDSAQAERYGVLIAEMLTTYFDELSASGRISEVLIVGTPYKSLPNAAKLLADVAERKLGASVPYLDVFSSRIYQHRLAVGDYGKLSSAMRDERNRQKKYFFDPVDFEGKHVVLIDDVRITGSIERSVMALLDDVDWESFTVANLVKLDPYAARENPQIEDELNHAQITSLGDLLPLMRTRDGFILITRTVKRILEAHPNEIREFLLALEPAQRAELYRAAVDDGYNQMGQYEQSFDILASLYPR